MKLKITTGKTTIEIGGTQKECDEFMKKYYPRKIVDLFPESKPINPYITYSDGLTTPFTTTIPAVSINGGGTSISGSGSLGSVTLTSNSATVNTSSNITSTTDTMLN